MVFGNIFAYIVSRQRSSKARAYRVDRVTTNQESICHRAFYATVDDVESLSLVRELGQRYKSNFTSTILCAQKSIYKIDQSLLLQKASEYPFLTQIARCTGWKRLWDDALYYGHSVIYGIQ